MLTLDKYNDEKIVNKLSTIYYINYDKIQGETIFRNRRNGDRIKFVNKQHTTTIKKLFNSEIPQNKRDNIIFLSDEKGVIFVEGYGISERVAIDNNTENILSITIINCEGEDNNEQCKGNNFC